MEPVRKNEDNLPETIKDDIKLPRRRKITSETDFEFLEKPLMKLACDTCAVIDICPYYKEGYECYFRFHKPKIDSKDGIRNAAQEVIKLQQERVLRAINIETMRGGELDRETSIEIVRLQQLLESLAKMEKVLSQAGQKKGFNLSFSGSASDDRHADQVLSKLFGEEAKRQEIVIQENPNAEEKEL